MTATSCSAGAGARRVRDWVVVATVCGFAHLSVEFSCSISITEAVNALPVSVAAIVVFNVLAFATQPIIGWWLDRSRSLATAFVVGGMFIVAAFVLRFDAAWPSVVLCAVGNAVFHVASGLLVWRRCPGRAAPLGVLVGPGAFGQSLGLIMPAAITPMLNLGAAVAILIGLAGPLLLTRYETSDAQPMFARRRAGVPVAAFVALILCCIALRSLIGLSLPLVPKESAAAIVAFGAAAAAGKIVGGILADRYGWLRTCVVAVALATPMLWWGTRIFGAGLAETAAFQVPMAVMLAALLGSGALRPGFAFGLASLALFVGSVPTVATQIAWRPDAFSVAATSLIALVLLVVALRPGRPEAHSRESTSGGQTAA